MNTNISLQINENEKRAKDILLCIYIKHPYFFLLLLFAHFPFSTWTTSRAMNLQKMFRHFQCIIRNSIYEIHANGINVFILLSSAELISITTSKMFKQRNRQNETITQPKCFCYFSFRLQMKNVLAVNGF